MDYAANCPISRPIHHENIKPDVDLNGVMFNYQYGFVFYAPEADQVTLKPPVWPFDQNMETRK